MENNKRHGLVWTILLLVLLLAIAIFWFISRNPSVLKTEDKNDPYAEETYEPTPINGYGVEVKNSSELGDYLAGPSGMTLYVTTRENCSGECLNAWLPYIVSAPSEEVGDISTIKRGNAFQQTYNGAPLFYYRLDEKPGDVKGHAERGEWFVARP